MKIKHVGAALAAILVAPATQAEPITPAEAHQRVFRAVKAVRDTIVPAPAIHFVETFPPVAVPRQKILQLAQIQPAAVPVAPEPPPPPVDPAGMAHWANSVAMAATDRALGGAFAGMFSSKVRKPLIVSTAPRDTKTLLQMEEDLNVMMRIVEKASSTREETKVMGIDVFALGGANSPRVFYIDGYGAMFLLRVKYPLLAPASKDEESRAGGDTSTEWEKARQEVYGRGQGEDRLFMREGHAEEFDAQRVEKLKNQLSDDLANATHIRHLKPDEFVTVVVSGGTARQTVVRQESKSGKGGAYAVSEKSMGDNPQSTMTLRAKKSDIDNFAKEKLNPEEFRKKVSVQIY